MSFSPENPSRRAFLRGAALLPIAVVGAACEIVDATTSQSGEVYPLPNSQGKEEYTVLLHKGPSEYQMTDYAILCHREKGKPPGLFPHRVVESRVQRQCEEVQAVHMKEKPQKGHPLVEGVTYDVIGPRQSVPLPKTTSSS